jgi:hypothetical protein
LVTITGSPVACTSSITARQGALKLLVAILFMALSQIRLSDFHDQLAFFIRANFPSATLATSATLLLPSSACIVNNLEKPCECNSCL